MNRTAVILASGLDTCFKKYTKYIPKGFIDYKGIPMIIKRIETLLSYEIEHLIIRTE